MAPMEDCPFCRSGRTIAESDLAFSLYDNYPVTPFHSIVVPRRHVGSFFDLTVRERADCMLVLDRTRKKILMQDGQIEGFNIGINDGAAAGQTVPHCHVHLIPRRKGDVKNPAGGVRHVLPGKGYYDARGQSAESQPRP